jgi:hypothetical protein
MAKSKKNAVTYGLSGKIGDLLVFRQVNGQTIVSQAADTPKTKSEQQAKHRKHFQQAVLYARVVLESPETGELYENAVKNKKGKRAFNVAVADFFHAPDIENIDLSEYGGNIGDRINIIARDDFAVKSVKVRIINPDGSIVEEGEAKQKVSALWVYTATQDNEDLNGDKIIVTASDLPGNVTEEEQFVIQN